MKVTKLSCVSVKGTLSCDVNNIGFGMSWYHGHVKQPTTRSSSVTQPNECNQLAVVVKIVWRLSPSNAHLFHLHLFLNLGLSCLYWGLQYKALKGPSNVFDQLLTAPSRESKQFYHTTRFFPMRLTFFSAYWEEAYIACVCRVGWEEAGYRTAWEMVG